MRSSPYTPREDVVHLGRHGSQSLWRPGSRRRNAFDKLTHAVIFISASLYLWRSFLGDPPIGCICNDTTNRVQPRLLQDSGQKENKVEFRKGLSRNVRPNYLSGKFDGYQSGQGQVGSRSHRRADWDSGPPEWCEDLRTRPIPNQAVPGTPASQKRCGRRTDDGLCYDGSEVTFFGQHHQDAYLYLKHFKFLQRRGVYLDIAANKHVEISNTYFFDRCLEWDGVCVEANPNYFSGLFSHRSCLLVPTCISSAPTEVPFRLDGAVGGIEATMPKIRVSSNKTTIEMKCVTLTSILERTGINEIDYLSLDVEGHELEVLHGVDLSDAIIKVITLEARKNKDAAEHLRKNGYVELSQPPVEQGEFPGHEFELRFGYDSIFLHPSVEFGNPR